MHHARRSPWLVAAGTLAVTLAATSGARAQNATRACEAAIQSEAGAFVQRRSNPIEACLRAILACRDKAKPAQAAACRAKLVLPDTGACAVGTLDAGVTALGTGAAAIAAEDAGGTDKLSTALRTMVAGLETDCFADPSVDLAGLGFTPAPADALALADRLNRVPGGLGCLANTEVGITSPLASTLIAEVAPYDGRCVAADLPADLHKKACAKDAECGPVSGRCGQLAYALKEGGGAGLSHCESCMPGASRAGGACHLCLAGRYSNTVDAASCTACAPGSFTDVEGSTSCNACPVGSFQPFEDQIDCPKCMRGTYADRPGSTSCAKCKAGTFSDFGAAQCTSCNAGTFSVAGSDSCTRCAAGEYSGRGASSCTQCAAGRYSDDGAAECSACPAGTYAKAGSSTCLTCPANAISGAEAGSCTACPANSTANPARTACQCNAGFYLPAGSAQCEACPVGAICQGGAIVGVEPPGFWTPSGQP